MRRRIILKKGNDCHRCLIGVMGNAQHQTHGDVFVISGGVTYVIPQSAIKKDGTIKAAYLKKMRVAA